MPRSTPPLPDKPTVEEFGKYLVHQGLGRGDSVITPGAAIWTIEHCEELIRDFVDRPDMGSGNFFEKLSAQLVQSSDGAIQLFAELYVLNVLPIVNVGGDLKVHQTEQILPMASQAPELPRQVKAALHAEGAYHGGQAFTNYRWAQIVYLIQFTRSFLDQDETTRAELLADPLKFRAAAEAVETGQVAQRQSLLYLAFPEFYVPSISAEHRKRIRAAFADAYLGHEPTDDLDKDLYEIRLAIERQTGEPARFYSPEWKSKWQKPAAPQTRAEPTDEVRKAWKVYGSNVNGRDMIPIWRTKGSVSLAAKRLRPVDPEIDREQLTGIVEQDYRDSGYAERLAKVDEFSAFLGEIHPGDLIVSVSQGQVHFGTVTGEAEYVQSSDGRSNLRRPVSWKSTIPSEDVPPEVLTRLNASGEVVQLTRQIDLLDELAARTDIGGHVGRLHLRDADDRLAARLHVPQAWLQECVELLRDRPQLIFYGPPGTGKTFIARQFAEHLAGENVRLVQFHPAYSYEDFFEGYRPAQLGSGQVGFELRPGPLRSLVDKAKENPDAVFVLIIDEINRGNLAKIFGELYFLLEYRDAEIDLLYSSDSTEQFSLPRNVVMLGTMNTADRSIALVDAAMRRRFSFVPMHPSEEPTNQILRNWLANQGRDGEFADLLDELNHRIDDNDFKIGPSYFMREAVAKPVGLERMWRTSILPLLEEFHYGDRNVEVSKRYGLTEIKKAIAAKAAAATTPVDTPADDDDAPLPDAD